MAMVETKTRQPNSPLPTLWGSGGESPRQRRSFNHGQPPCHARPRRRFSGPIRCSRPIPDSPGQPATTPPRRRRIIRWSLRVHAAATSHDNATPPTDCVWWGRSCSRAPGRQLSTHHRATHGHLRPHPATYPEGSKWCFECRTEGGGVADHAAHPRRGWGDDQGWRYRRTIEHDPGRPSAGDRAAAGSTDVTPVSLAAQRSGPETFRGEA